MLTPMDREWVDVELLDDALARDDALPMPEELFRVTQWRPATIEQAEWAARKLIECDRRINELRAEIDGYLERVQAWAQDQRRHGELRALLDRYRFFESVLADYALRRRDQATARRGESTAKTTILPSATVRTRVTGSHRGTYEVVDPDALLTWAKANCPLVVETVETVNVALIGKHGVEDGRVYDNEGEVIPGLRYVPPTPGRVTATVSFNDEGAF